MPLPSVCTFTTSGGGGYILRIPVERGSQVKSFKSVVVGVLAAVVVFGGIQVVSGVTDNKQIKACANKKSGVMRYTTKSCKKNETTLVFNSQGVPGAKGDTGVAGADLTAAVYAIGATGPGGGIVFMLPSTAGNTTGKYFEAAPADSSTSIAWCSDTSTLLGTTVGGLKGAIGNGAANTALMLATCTSGAAVSADVYISPNGKSDWFLPSKGELNLMYVNRVAIGGFVAFNYWSSSENNGSFAWSQNFYYGNQNYFSKINDYYVRPVRAF